MSRWLWYFNAIADGPIIKDKFWKSVILPAKDIDNFLIGLISKRINKTFSQNCYLNIINPDYNVQKPPFFCSRFDGKKRGYIIICENPLDLIYYHNDYVYNSVHFFDSKIKISENLLSLIHECKNTVKLQMLQDGIGVFRAEELKNALKEKGIFVL